MTDTFVTVTDPDGVVLAVALVVPEGKTPAQVGWPTSPRHRFFTVPARPDPETQRFDAALGRWVENLAAIEAQIIAAIKDEAERRKMTMASPGGMKKSEYAEKRAEVVAWKTLGATAGTILSAFNLLPLATRQTKFAHAIASAAAFGDTPADAIARFEAGMSKSAPTAVVSAAEEKVCAMVRAATTAASKRAAAAGWL